MGLGSAVLKRVAARCPRTWQFEMKRWHFARQMRKGTFVSPEPEFRMLSELLRPGDWAVDIGANVGHYTRRFSELVGPRGRVVAFEPVPVTFSLLSVNAQLFPNSNVTLINAALSDRLSVTGMSVPNFASGLTNYYEAQVSATGDGDFSVLTLPLDSLHVEQRVALVKIDAEGHEAQVLAGMPELLRRHRPTLIVETGSQAVIDGLRSSGYASQRLPGSPNVLFRPVA